MNAFSGAMSDISTLNQRMLRESAGPTKNSLGGFTLKHVKKVERQNSFRINLFGFEAGHKFPLHVSREKFEDEMSLLLLTEDENSHYVLIRDFNILMHSITKDKETLLHVLPSPFLLGSQMLKALPVLS